MPSRRRSARHVLARGLCIALGLAGCGERDAARVPAAAPLAAAASAVPRPAGTPPPAATAPPAAAVVVETLRGMLREGGPELTVLALAPDATAAADPDAAIVAAIDIRAGDGSLSQRIDGLEVRVAPAGGPVLELVDLDFDGVADLRLMEAPSAGPNTGHRNWRFDPAAARFVPVPALDELPGVQVVAAARELRSTWRDGPSLYGTDVYALRDGELQPIRRERRRYSRPGVYTLEISRPEGSGWKLVEKRTGRD